MTRQIFIFVATFLVGALAALAARTALHDPHAHSATADLPAAAHPAPAPVSDPAPSAHAANHQTEHAGGAAAKASASAVASTDAPVNTVCAICGMNVDPKLPTLEYQGKKIGFGCRMCPPKFKADPDKYGPFYLRNEVIKN